MTNGWVGKFYTAAISAVVHSDTTIAFAAGYFFGFVAPVMMNACPRYFSVTSTMWLVVSLFEPQTAVISITYHPPINLTRHSHGAGVPLLSVPLAMRKICPTWLAATDRLLAANEDIAQGSDGDEEEEDEQEEEADEEEEEEEEDSEEESDGYSE